MAIMYFSFETNLPDSTKNEHTLSVDYIAFRGKNDEVISVSCNQDSDWFVQNGLYAGRFKGLEVKVEDFNTEKLTHDYETMSEEDFNLLKTAKLYEIGFEEDSDYNGPDPIEGKNISVEIRFNVGAKNIHNIKFFEPEFDIM